jgi:hypothetical protein
VAARYRGRSARGVFERASEAGLASQNMTAVAKLYD